MLLSMTSDPDSITMSRNLYGGAFAAILLIAPDLAQAAVGLDGATLRWPWALPFIGILVTIATGPLLFKRFWHRHYGKLAFAWSVLTLAPLAAVYGTPAALAAFAHAMLGEYLSFIVLLFALYVVAGGILVTGELRANAARLDNIHVVVFFIFLVANIGGALSPLGDPPLFVGFLHGVVFFWTTRHLA